MNNKMKIIFSILTVLLLIFSFSSVAFGDPPSVEITDVIRPADSNPVKAKLETPIEAVMGVLALIAGAIAVGMVIVIGIKYMTKGAGGKAEVKDTLLPYLIGAILVGGATGIAAAIISMAP